MDTALPQKFPFILDRNLAKANCTGNRVCTSCDIVVLATGVIDRIFFFFVLFVFIYEHERCKNTKKSENPGIFFFIIKKKQNL